MPINTEPGPAVRFGREVCGDLEVAERREWLATNGLGGFASGTVSGNLTRRYHGLLVAALHPPVDRVLLVSKLDEVARYDGANYPLATNRWVSGAVEPKGYSNIESFRLEGSIPVWEFALADALVEKRIWMRQGENTTYVRYASLRGGGAVELDVAALVNYRDFHGSTQAVDWHMNVEAVRGGLKVAAFEQAAPFYLLSAEASCQTRNEWYRGYFLPRERERELEDHEDHLLAAVFRATLQAKQSITLVFSTNADAALDAEAILRKEEERQKIVLTDWEAAHPQGSAAAPVWLGQLALAADQFLVKRELPEEPEGRSIIAGYHWFADWGRDTMIALPGLTLTTGRADIAKQILLAFSRYVDQGMPPNNFPDSGGRPQYNTVDASLWFFEAVRQYVAATEDFATLEKLFPVMAGMIEAHVAGTRYRIHVDQDGLLYAGEPGVQLTWMDAKVGDWVVTPRIGKPVEVNALWYNALETMAALAARLKRSAEMYASLAARARNSFGRFWNAERSCCYDVIDAPGVGNDAAVRPNQIFAVSLPHSPLTREQQKAVVDRCASQLVTLHGMRSLAPDDPAYQGHYSGGVRERDGAYHQGTVWGWLLGPFALAHYRVYKDAKTATDFLASLGQQIAAYGLGTLGEIFDGDAPFAPRGCIAQAWTVAETLRAWHAIQEETWP